MGKDVEGTITFILFFYPISSAVRHEKHEDTYERSFCREVWWRSHKLFECISHKRRKKIIKCPTHNICCPGTVPNQRSPSCEAEMLRIHCDILLIPLISNIPIHYHNRFYTRWNKNNLRILYGISKPKVARSASQLHCASCIGCSFPETTLMRWNVALSLGRDMIYFVETCVIFFLCSRTTVECLIDGG